MACEDSNNSTSPPPTQSRRESGLFLTAPPSSSQLAVKRHSHQGAYVRNNVDTTQQQKGPYAQTGLMPKSSSIGHVALMNRRKSSTYETTNVDHNGKVHPKNSAPPTTDLTLYVSPAVVQNEGGSSEQMAYIAGHVLSNTACKETFV